MLRKSFKVKVFVIFLLPTIVLVYFSFYFISARYEELNRTSAYALSANIIGVSSQLIHDIQLERGMSAGYIVAKEKSLYKDRLIAHYVNTDRSYQDFLYYIGINNKEKQIIRKMLFRKNKIKVKNLLSQMHLLHSRRDAIKKSQLGFESVIEYYTYINTQLMGVIYNFSVLIYDKYNNTMDIIYRMQHLKESAGLERAYLYNQLLSEKVNMDMMDRIKELILEQEKFHNELKASLTPKAMVIYNDTVKASTYSKLERYRNDFMNGRLGKEDAKQWFEISTERIDEFENLSMTIGKNYLNNMVSRYNKAINSLIVTSILWILSIISLGVLFYLLSKLVGNEARLIEDLRIAAYSFDAHEAMTVTDPQGTILRVNKAFTRITGYEPEEVIGKNPKVLKSSRHEKEFYAQMWKDIHIKGYWSDEIYNKRKNGEEYLERLSITAIKNNDGATTHYIAQFLDISDLKKAEMEAIHQASHDFLTKLPNRKSMMHKLQVEFVRAKRHTYNSAFLFIDLDNFKNINDTYGHMIGDQLLLRVTDRLKQCVREEDYIARMSGDEFCVIVLNLSSDSIQAASDIKKISKTILSNIASPYFIEKHKVSVSASIGVKIFPEDSKNIKDIISHADTAMYKAKEDGKNTFIYYDKSIEKKMKETSVLEREVRVAISSDQFKFYFQPKVCIQSGDILGAEFLLRWQHPVKGICYPGYFIHILKDIGLMGQITIKALHQASQFLKSNPDALEKGISINIPAYKLMSAEFIASVENIIASYGICPSLIELEILESDIIEDFDIIVANMQKLKDFGLKFSIDDFGIGYSSLSYLQKLPIDTIKIDKYFIQNISEYKNKELIGMVTNIAKTFGFSTVIEGVETKEQLDFAKSAGADSYQGFYKSEAIDESSFKSLLAKNNQL